MCVSLAAMASEVTVMVKCVFAAAVASEVTIMVKCFCCSYGHCGHCHGKVCVSVAAMASEVTVMVKCVFLLQLWPVRSLSW